jgi:hypothetical protein
MPRLLAETLFLKDGPLLLRAQLARLVEPIRDFIETLKRNKIALHLVGIEKNGDLVDHIEEIKKHLPNPGDYFLPTVRYLQEEVAGLAFSPKFRTVFHLNSAARKQLTSISTR